ncbi:MAG: class I SAM-dependent methyltransferase [Gammaproteobacteria bacterium]|nr:class I SAM-dependent methyltransferase [Gammaproteobacteria bacterium]
MSADGSYDDAIATHYDAYRPPLHTLILSLLLENAERFDTGLDIGCGTGRSSAALQDYCRQVIGIEPSHAMLGRAASHPDLHYVEGVGDSLPLTDSSVDIVTLAGVLYYAKTSAFVRELLRVSRPGAIVVAYDFDVRLDGVLSTLMPEIFVTPRPYDPTVNFSGENGLFELMVRHKTVQLEMSAEQLAHVVLSNAERHRYCQIKFASLSPHAALAGVLGQHHARLEMSADIYYAKYRVG